MSQPDRPAAVPASSRLLDTIAGLLGTTPEAFHDPACLAKARQGRAALFAGLLAADPQFARIAQAFLDVQDPAGRRAIADSVVSIAGAFAMQTALRSES